MIFFIFSLFFFFSAHSDVEFSWDTRQTHKIIEVKKTISAFKDQTDCNESQSVSGVIDIFEILNKEKFVQDLVEPYKREFLCEVDKYVSEQNEETKKDKEFMLSYLDQKDQITDKDHLKMTELLIKYRILRDGNGKEYFVSATRFQPPEQTKKQIKQLAEKYIGQFGPPQDCFFVLDNKVKKKELTNIDCQKEISLRVSPIPAPLILTQSVLESQWGNSSLAQEESNILGLQVKFRNPSTMPNYPNCRPAKKAPDRCLLKFDNYKGSVYEYFSRFNSSHFGGYSKYRETRQKIYNKSDQDSCEEAIRLSNAVDFYAENPNYITEIQSMINTQICQMMSTACLNSSLTAKY